MPTPTPHDIAAAAADLITDYDSFPPVDPVERRAVDRERGWAEAVRHFAGLGLFTAAGLTEAGKVLAASGDWLGELRADAGGPAAADALPPDAPLWRVAEAHIVARFDIVADHLAAAWYTLATLPDGQWAVRSGGWCQGVGSDDHTREVYPTKPEALARFFATARGLCTRPVPGDLDWVQDLARTRLLAKLDEHERAATAPLMG